MRPLFEPGLRDSSEDQSADYSERPFRKIVAPYNRIAHELFELTNLEDCDLAVVPVDWEHVRGGSRLVASPDRELVSAIQNFSERAAQAGKPVLIFFSSSMSHEPVPIRGAHVFRHAMYRSQSTDRDWAMPIVIARDIRQEFPDASFAPVERSDRPRVSFCGFVRSTRMSEKLKSIPYRAYTYAKTSMSIPSPYIGLELRKRCLSLLQDSPLIDTDFIAQKKGVYLTRDKARLSKRESFRWPFVKNILDSPYHLSLRGSSNHSFRHWEILCCGRIPLYIDTDCGIPATEFVDWSRFMVVVPEGDVERVAEFLDGFHHRCSGPDLADAQESARAAWEQWCTPHGFASNLHKYVENMTAS